MDSIQRKIKLSLLKGIPAYFQFNLKWLDHLDKNKLQKVRIQNSNSFCRNSPLKLRFRASPISRPLARCYNHVIYTYPAYALQVVTSPRHGVLQKNTAAVILYILTNLLCIFVRFFSFSIKSKLLTSSVKKKKSAYSSRFMAFFADFMVFLM